MNVEAAMVRTILEKWRAYEWTVQGFGMVRTKIADVARIHIWDSRYAVPHVSTMHEHPWPLKSRIISGELINQRFVLTESEDEGGLPYMHSRIATGEGGGLLGTPDLVRIRSLPPESYFAGDMYAQTPSEAHRSIPQDGTVTLMERPLGPPLQETSVYWPRGTVWVSAEPRAAESWEVQQAVEYALARWDAR